MGTFDVLAGKYDGDERNCKYCDSFESFDEAIVAYFSVSDYPWYEMIYNGLDHTQFIVYVNAYPEHLR